MRSHYCGHVNEGLIGQEVTVAGWVHRRRDHGGVIFVDLRDREGLLQVVFDPDFEAIFAEAERLRGEYVLTITGTVRERPEGTINPNMPTGQVEVLARELTVLNASKTPPFHHDENASEEMRLRYRYLDLRREQMQRNLRLRHEVARTIRGYLDAQGFVEMETPILTKTTPEGARDYLVPSRTHPGQFFALPQSPQLMKQLLMMSGFDRYYQIVKCFRDEDLRADRQPEFTQVDIETAFSTSSRSWRSWNRSFARRSSPCSTSSCQIHFRASRTARPWRATAVMRRICATRSSSSRLPISLETSSSRFSQVPQTTTTAALPR